MGCWVTIRGCQIRWSLPRVWVRIGGRVLGSRVIGFLGLASTGVRKRDGSS